MTLTNIRICTKCGEKKPLTLEFWNPTEGGGFRGSCRLCMAKHSREYHAKNPEKAKARRERYKDRLHNAVGTYQEAELRLLRQKQHDKCRYCGDDLKGGGERDHIVPLSRGGTNWIANMAWACLICNRDKGSKTASEFFAWRRRQGRKIAPPMVLVVKRQDIAKKIIVKRRIIVKKDT